MNVLQCKLALEILEKYKQVGAVKEVCPESSRFRLPWFVISKEELGGTKHRLICNAKKLNSFLSPQKFRMDHWAQIFPFLRVNWWGAKIDLKDAYFHLGVHPSLRPYLHLEVQGKIFEFQAACFGLSTLPQIWTQIMKTFLKKWRRENFLVFIYLDDILLLAPTPEQVRVQFRVMLRDLDDAGMMVNEKKSILQPTQKIQHLGFQINFQDGRLQLPKEKISAIRKDLGKLVKKPFVTCRKMAAILGAVRSFLMALPFLRAFSDQIKDFVSQNTTKGWDTPLPVPEGIFRQVRELNFLTKNWPGRPFVAPPKGEFLRTPQIWPGGVDPESGAQVSEFWRDKSHLHINVKELQAAMDSIRSLARPGEVVKVHVDNSVAFSYLTKQGGRLPGFNNLMRPFLRWQMLNNVTLQTELVRTYDQLADKISRRGGVRRNICRIPYCSENFVKFSDLGWCRRWTSLPLQGTIN